MNYDNNQKGRRKLPRLGMSTGGGYVRNLPMPYTPSSGLSGSDVLRNFAGRGAARGPVVERPMLPTFSMARGGRRRMGPMLPQDMDRETLMQVLSRVAGGAF